jgi:hypothetical protein
MDPNFKSTSDPAVLHNAAIYVEQVGDEMTQAVKILMGDLEALPTAWRGPAAAAYYGDGYTEGAVGHWQRKHTELIAACKEIAERLRTTARAYVGTESDNVAAARGATPQG